MQSVKQIIRDIPDFPKEGIIFKDITPLLADASAFGKTINTLKERYADKQIDTVVGVEARGFIFASALAYALEAGTTMVRKPGKLPYKTYQETYSLDRKPILSNTEQTLLKFIRMLSSQENVSSLSMTFSPQVEPLGQL